jgi:hypothetical protein
MFLFPSLHLAATDVDLWMRLTDRFAEARFDHAFHIADRLSRPRFESFEYHATVIELHRCSDSATGPSVGS